MDLMLVYVLSLMLVKSTAVWLLTHMQFLVSKTFKDPDFRIFKTTSGKIQNELALPEVAAGCGPVQARTDAVICEGV